MKVVSFTYLSRQKKQKKAKIFCIGKVFKPTFFAMFTIFCFLVANLIINNFFSNITASLQNFVESFVKFFWSWWTMKGLIFKVHWSFIVLGILMICFGKFKMFFCAIITVILHEMGHSFVGRKLGYRLNLITLLPYGAMLSGKNTPYKSSDEIKIAIAGPLVNAILIISNIILCWVFPNYFNLSNYFFASNVYTLLFNMLPVYPLDGGRILVALFSTKMSRIKAEKKTKTIGYIITTIFFVMFFISFFYDLNYMLGINALFMLIGLFGEDSAPYYQKINSFETVSFFNNNKTIKLQKQEPIFVAYKYVTENNAKQIQICDNGQVIKCLTKKDIVSSVLNFPIDTKLEKLC